MSRSRSRVHATDADAEAYVLSVFARLGRNEDLLSECSIVDIQLTPHEILATHRMLALVSDARAVTNDGLVKITKPRSAQ